MRGETLLMVQLSYGSGLRLMECLRLLVKDVGFEQPQIMVRDPKGMHDRITRLPVTLDLSLQAQLQAVKHLPEHDLASGHGGVSLPNALGARLGGTHDAPGLHALDQTSGAGVTDPQPALEHGYGSPALTPHQVDGFVIQGVQLFFRLHLFPHGHLF